MTEFHELFPCSQYTVVIKQQYCNTVEPKLNSDHFTQYIMSQTWQLKRLFFNYLFVFHTRYEHFSNLEWLHSGYVSEIL